MVVDMTDLKSGEGLFQRRKKRKHESDTISIITVISLLKCLREYFRAHCQAVDFRELKGISGPGKSKAFDLPLQFNRDTQV